MGSSDVPPRLYRLLVLSLGLGSAALALAGTCVAIVGAPEVFAAGGLTGLGAGALARVLVARGA